MKVGVFVPCYEWRPGEVEWQIAYLHRFLKELNASDFPKDYDFLVSGPGTPISTRYREGNARNYGISKLSEDHEFVVLSDADVLVPKVWWSFFKTLFDHDPKIGVILPTIVGFGWSDPSRRHLSHGLRQVYFVYR